MYNDKYQIIYKLGWNCISTSNFTESALDRVAECGTVTNVSIVCIRSIDVWSYEYTVQKRASQDVEAENHLLAEWFTWSQSDWAAWETSQ